MIIHIVFPFLVGEKNNDYLNSPHFLKQKVSHLLLESTPLNKDPPGTQMYRKSKLIVDATCTPADIKSPTDLNL